MVPIELYLSRQIRGTPSDQSVSAGAIGLVTRQFMVRPLGFEPRTCGLRVGLWASQGVAGCSAISWLGSWVDSERGARRRGAAIWGVGRIGQIMTSRYHDAVSKQTTVRLPDELADEAEAVARVRGTSLNQLIIDSLGAEIDRVRADDDFTARANRLLQRDREILDRLAK